jgi:hypothetical protein
MAPNSPQVISPANQTHHEGRWVEEYHYLWCFSLGALGAPKEADWGPHWEENGDFFLEDSFLTKMDRAMRVKAGGAHIAVGNGVQWTLKL